MKSKAEIVVETLLHYNLKNRGYNRAAYNCTYLDKATGNKCAVGRCILDSELEKVSEYEQKCLKKGNGSPSVSKLAENFNDLDSLLKPEYRGHGIALWDDLQYIHDSSHLWTDDGFNWDLSYISRVFGPEVAEAVKAALAEKTA